MYIVSTHKETLFSSNIKKMGTVMYTYYIYFIGIIHNGIVHIYIVYYKIRHKAKTTYSQNYSNSKSIVIIHWKKYNSLKYFNNS